MKTKDELNALRNEVDALNKKLAELNEDELKEITGGADVRPEHQYYKWKGIYYTKLYSDCPGQNDCGCMKCPHRHECTDFSLLDLSYSGIVEEEYNQQKRA